MSEAAEPSPSSAAASLQGLPRASWHSVLQVGLLLGVLSVMISTVTGLDLDEIAAELQGASWALVVVGLLIAQGAPVSQAAVALGAASRPLPAGPVLLLQLALGYVTLAVPARAGRVAMNVRFFQKQGFSAGAALAKGLVGGGAALLVQSSIFLGLVVFAPGALHVDLQAPDLSDWRRVIGGALVIAILVALASTAHPDARRQLRSWRSSLAAEGHHTLEGLGSPRRLLLLLGGNVAAVVARSAALGLFAAALGTRVPAADVLVIVIAASLLASVLPLPGGLGLVEGGLTFGLVSAGMPEGPAFAAVVLYRLSTLFLPATWGYLAFRHLEHHGYL